MIKQSKKIQYTHSGGFAALMAVIIISLILLSQVFTVSGTSFYVRFDLLDREYKQKSYLLAESCAKVVMRRLSQNYHYLPLVFEEEVAIYDGYCHIVEVIHGIENANHAKDVSIQTQGNIGNSYTNIITTVYIRSPFAPYAFSLPEMKVLSIVEIPNK